MKNKSMILEGVSVSAEKSKLNIKYCTELSRWVLTPLGIWTNENNKNIINKISSTVLIFMCYFLILFLIVPCSLHTFINERDPRIKMKMIGPLSFCLMAISKFSFLVTRKKDIYNCFKHIYHDWRQVQLIDDENIMLENAGKGRFITIICAAFMYGGGFFYHTIMPFAVGSFVTSDNKTIKPLTYPVYDPLFSAQETPNYQIVFTLQWFAGFVMYSITIGACSLAAVFAFHACGQLKIVISRLDNFVDLNHNIDDVLKKKMADIIERHLRTLRFIVRVEEILNELNLIEFLGCTFNICMLVYYFMSEFEKAEVISTITYCVLLISFTFNIFIFCYIGEMLTQQGLKVGWAAYNNINWYELSRKNSRGIILIMAISNNPCSLTAGKMTSLSYASFCSVIRSSMAYLNILRTVVL
ncbi:odorant receptor Or2-like [Aphidius gifuensis]|uniref:odorant receptor Or2-like n=1 Tax=Aphidius gifuensis TaxID=684658 RepID=UPI001CDB6573|nr:odorant receptor Or2-like [Aphidius gifuensis]